MKPMTPSEFVQSLAVEYPPEFIKKCAEVIQQEGITSIDKEVELALIEQAEDLIYTPRAYCAEVMEAEMTST